MKTIRKKTDATSLAAVQQDRDLILIPMGHGSLPKKSSGVPRKPPTHLQIQTHTGRTLNAIKQVFFFLFDRPNFF